eukprot:752432-Hanusia_phi.AAC.3
MAAPTGPPNHRRTICITEEQLTVSTCSLALLSPGPITMSLPRRRHMTKVCSDGKEVVANILAARRRSEVERRFFLGAHPPRNSG